LTSTKAQETPRVIALHIHSIESNTAADRHRLRKKFLERQIAFVGFGLEV
jgi:hypothetical protein